MDRETITEWLDETAFYIEQVVGTEQLEEHHKKMFKAIDEAIELLKE